MDLSIDVLSILSILCTNILQSGIIQKKRTMTSHDPLYSKNFVYLARDAR